MEPDTQQPATGDVDMTVAPREAPPMPEMDRRRDDMPEKAPSESETGPLDDEQDEDVDDDEIESDEAALDDEDDDLDDEDETEEDEETDEGA